MFRMFGLGNYVKDWLCPFRDEDVLLNDLKININEYDSEKTRIINISYRIDNKTFDNLEIYGLKVKLKFNPGSAVSLFDKIEQIKINYREYANINIEMSYYVGSKTLNDSIDLEISHYIEYWGRKTIVTKVKQDIKFEQKKLYDSFNY